MGTGLWTLIAGSGSIATPTSPATLANGLGVGTNVFQWTISNGVCPPSVSTVSISNFAIPTVASAGPSMSLCATTATSLSGNIPAIGTGSWTLISGTASITSPTLPSTGITGLGIGVHVFQWTISNGVCAVSPSTMSITNFDNPTVSNAGLSQTICATATVLAGNAPSIGTGTWSLVSGTAAITNTSNPASGITGIGVGQNVFQWSVGNGVCPVSTSTVLIERNDFPSLANAGPNQTVCVNNSDLNAVTPLVGTGVWNVISGGGTVTNPTLNTSAVTNLTLGINILEWVVSNGVCRIQLPLCL